MNADTIKQRLQEVQVESDKSLERVHASIEWREHLFLQGRIAELKTILQMLENEKPDTE